MGWFDTIFGGGQHIGIGQECARAVVVLLYGLVLVRAGRRVFGKWSAIDIVVSVILGSNLSRALTGNAPFLGTLIASTLLLALHWLLVAAAARWRIVSRIVEGAPVTLARDGRVLHGARIRHAVTEADLHEALRQSGLTDAAGTRLITLEPSGKITVLK
jgi:uncharacterized membrane protein YcaP (DUF421 family)